MIRLVIKREIGIITEFEINGHADFANGNDIVCAAVSGIVYTALGYFNEKYGTDDFIEKEGLIKWKRPLKLFNNISVDAVLEAMIIGIRQVELQYEKNVKVMDEEV